jgi:hypothetical protein
MRYTPSKTLKHLTIIGLVIAAIAFIFVGQAVGQDEYEQNLARKFVKVIRETGEAPFHEYKGVTLGMATEIARQKLGEPTSKSDEQDFYLISDYETVQVFYKESKVIAIVVMLSGGKLPTCKEILGEEAAALENGSRYKMVEFKQAGYWVSYNRTAGDSPLVSITLKKIE